jgi:hypothetical protein
MSGIYVLGIVPKHDEDKLRTPADEPDDAAHGAFDHELSDKPQPYFPAEDDKKPVEQS